MVIHWFRRDLRLADNPAFWAARRESEAVLPVYIASDWHGRHRWTGPARQTALCQAVRALASDLARLGYPLIVRRGDACAELERLVTETRATAIHFNRSPDPGGRALEQRVEAMDRRLGISIRSFHDVTALEPGAILTQSGEFYRVFTPFSRAWLQHEPPEPLPTLPRAGRAFPPPPSLPLPAPSDWGLAEHAGLAESSERAARRRMEAFLAEPVTRYAKERDLPAVDATSRLSTDLRLGTLSPRLLVRQTKAAIAAATTAGARDSARKFLGELIWREFYMAILHRWPEVQQHEFQPQFRRLRWSYDTAAFQRWSEGTTGFPIVDAGMRQLAATGWMHNRVRMIVAMFLTKDLHIDWREGEAFFMRSLADGEIASNNGGWQWSAGVGADAAPYFRIQNPWTQTARYDPDGLYIKRWVPELRHVPAPALARVPGSPLAPGYPLPIVDHAREREVTLAMFRPISP